MQFGDTFIMGPNGHLWVVISDRTKHSDKFVIANLTTNARRAGNECELNKGDHPWITQKSYVSFADAREVSCEQEATMLGYISTGVITKHYPMDQKVLEMIIASAARSKALPTGLRKYF
jgi:hypothetical protein